MRKFSNKKVAAVALGAVALTGTGVAYAYWTSTGTGSGSATAGNSSAFVVTTDAATGGPLSPGGPTQTVAFHVQNTNSGVQRLQAVAVTVANANGSAWSSGTCDADDFLVGTPAFTPGDIASGADIDGTVTIQMKNNNENQDDCEGVTVPLYVAAS